MSHRGAVHRPILVRLAWVAVFVSLWEFLRWATSISPLLLPAVPSILGALATAFIEGDLLRQLALSFGVIAAATAVALVLALVLVLASALSPLAASGIDTLNALLHPLPAIAVLPVVIVWFGTGTPAVFVVIVHSVLWPLFTNIRAGYRSLPRTYLLVGRNLGLRGIRLFTRVIVPAALPHVVSGLRVAWARAWRALISAEMVFGAMAGVGGIGWFLFTQRVFMNGPGLFAGIAVVMVVGVVVEEGLFSVLDRRIAVRWGET